MCMDYMRILIKPVSLINEVAFSGKEVRDITQGFCISDLKQLYDSLMYLGMLKFALLICLNVLAYFF